MKHQTLPFILVMIFSASMILGESTDFTPRTAISIDGSSFRINGELTYKNLHPRAHGLLMNVQNGQYGI